MPSSMRTTPSKGHPSALHRLMTGSRWRIPVFFLVVQRKVFFETRNLLV